MRTNEIKYAGNTRARIAEKCNATGFREKVLKEDECL